MLLSECTIQLCRQIEHDLSQRVCILRQLVRINRHRASRLTENRSPSKQKQKQVEMFLCVCAVVAFAPRGRAQIDAAQQGSEFLDRDLQPMRVGLSGRNNVAALLQTFRPDPEPVTVPIQNLDPVAPPAGEDEKMSSERI